MNVVAEDSKDPLIKEAIALNAFEEQGISMFSSTLSGFMALKSTKNLSTPVHKILNGPI